MIDAIVYISFAMIEVMSILYIILAISRLRFNDYLKEMMVGVTIVSICTYLFKEIKTLNEISPMLCLLVFLSILIFVFRISLIHSIIVVVIGYIVCMLIQGVIILIPVQFSNLTFGELKENDVLRYLFQTISAIVIFSVGAILNKKKIGFIFVPYSPSLKFRITKKNMHIVYLLITTLFVSGIVLDVDKMIIGIVMLAILFTFSLFMAIRREKGDVTFD